MRWTSSVAATGAKTVRHVCAIGMSAAAGLAGSILSMPAHAATAAQIDTARTNGLAYLYQAQNQDGSWGSQPGLKVTATSSVIEALMNAGISRGAAYNAAVSSLANAEPPSTDGLARQLDTLYHTGNATAAQITQLNAATNYFSAWGTLPGQGSNIADTALAMRALLDASSTYANSAISTALCNIVIPAQTSGGWGYLPRPAGINAPAGLTGPAILPTAYTLLALQKINASRFTGLNCGGTSYTLSTVMANGVNWLLTKKNADNGFGENGTSGALETALAYRAIAAVSPGHAALGPAQDYLIATQQAGGAWAGDPLQTAFVLQSLPATTMADTQGSGVPDAVAAVIWPGGQGNPRSLVGGNGQSVQGQNRSTVVGSATVNQPFSGHLASPNGSGPYTYKLLSGALPDGVSLAADGTLAGEARVAGTFNFTYQVTDGQGNVTTLAAEIVANAESGDVPTLPQWGALLLAGLLLARIVRQPQSR